ncbi:MAG: hypothetical protein AAB910_01920 [Patescibacteria group bacterium]|mgnify:FL=1
MTNEQPAFDPDKTQEFKPASLKREIEKQIEEADADLKNVVAELPGGIVLRDLKFEGIDLTIVGTDENGVRLVVPFKEFDSVKLRPK